MNRRDFLAIYAIPTCLATAATTLSAATTEERPVEFQLKETAGLRRYGYPVHVVLPTEFTRGGPGDEAFTLTRDDREVPAQFRRVEQLDRTSVVSLDFNASVGPFEVQKYAVKHNSGVKPAAVTARGMGVRQRGSDIEISNGPHIQYTVSDNLAGLIRSVRIPSLEFIKDEDSSGLFVVVKGRKILLSHDRRSPLDPPVRIRRQGPMAVGAQSRSQIGLEGSGTLNSLVDMTFPSSKSWIEVVWTLDRATAS
jgi:hypothetical protein